MPRLSVFFPERPAGTALAALLGAALVALLVAGCDSGEGPEPTAPPTETNSAPTATASVSASQVEAGTEVTFDAAESSDPDGDALTFRWDFGDGENAGGETAAHTYSDAGEYSPTLTVNDPDGATDSDEIAVTVMEAAPENRAPDAVLELSSTELAVGDELTADASESSDPDGDELSYTIDFGDGTTASDAEATRTYDGAGDFTVTLTVSDGSLETVAEETVTVREVTQSVTVEAVSLEDGETLSSQVTIRADGTVTASGMSPLTAAVPEGAELSASLDRLELETRVFADTTQAFSAASAPVQIAQRRLPACSDGINNDGDNFIDAKDAGCVEGFDGFATDADGNLINYDRDDDNEVLKAFRTQIGIGSEDTLKVSSDGPLEVLWRNVGSPLPLSVKAATGEVELYMDTGRESNQEEEAVAIRLETGESHRNTTYENTNEVVPDDNEQDGFDLTQFHGVDRNWFPDGRFFNVYVRHGCDVAGNPLNLSCDGDDDVILILPASLPGNQRVSLSFFFRFEEEEVPSDTEAAKLSGEIQTVNLSAQEMNRRVEEK